MGQSGEIEIAPILLPWLQATGAIRDSRVADGFWTSLKRAIVTGSLPRHCGSPEFSEPDVHLDPRWFVAGSDSLGLHADVQPANSAYRLLLCKGEGGLRSRIVCNGQDDWQNKLWR